LKACHQVKNGQASWDHQPRGQNGKQANSRTTMYQVVKSNHHAHIAALDGHAHDESKNQGDYECNLHCTQANF
jgi:hypothetical protein